MSNEQNMSPEDFIAWATSEIEIAKSEGGDAGRDRLDNVRKQIDVAKAFSFEGNVVGLPVEQIDVPPPSTTEVSPDKAQTDKGNEGVALNMDEVAKRLTDELDELKKSVDESSDDDDKTDVDKTDEQTADESSAKPFEWPDDLNDEEPALDWGGDGEPGTDDETE